MQEAAIADPLQQRLGAMEEQLAQLVGSVGALAASQQQAAAAQSRGGSSRCVPGVEAEGPAACAVCTQVLTADPHVLSCVPWVCVWGGGGAIYSGLGWWAGGDRVWVCAGHVGWLACIQGNPGAGEPAACQRHARCCTCAVSSPSPSRLGLIKVEL